MLQVYKNRTKFRSERQQSKVNHDCIIVSFDFSLFQLFGILFDPLAVWRSFFFINCDGQL